jgi:hypothetical protein
MTIPIRQQNSTEQKDSSTRMDMQLLSVPRRRWKWSWVGLRSRNPNAVGWEGEISPHPPYDGENPGRKKTKRRKE